MTDRRRDWRGGLERGHPAGLQPHRESGRQGAGLVRRCRGSGGGQAQAVLAPSTPRVAWACARRDDS
jgi:hypothetical protein